MEHPRDTSKRPLTPPSTTPHSSVFSASFVAGGMAGAVSRTVVSPLERAKILFQVQNSKSAVVEKGKGFDTLSQTFVRIWREEGVVGLFKGNGTNILRIVPYSSVQFSTYELLQRVLKRLKGENIGVTDRLMAGAGAGIVAATSTYPLDLARTRLSLSSDVPQRILPCLVHVYREEGGVMALYRGLTPTLLGIAPLVALNFTLYEFFKATSRSHLSGSSGGGGQEERDISVTVKLACGGAAGACAQTVTYPLDVLRRRLQTTGLLGYGYTGFMDAAVRMYREEGLGAFYRGLLPNYLKVVPAVSISFVVYESIKYGLEG